MTIMALRTRVAQLAFALPLLCVLLIGLYRVGPGYWITGQLTHQAITSDEVLFSIVVSSLLAIAGWGIIDHWFVEAMQMSGRTLQSEAHQVSIVDAFADAIVSTDTQGCIVSWNHGAETLFGYTLGEITGHPFSALMGGSPSAEIEGRWLLESVLREGYIRGHETTCHNDAGYPIDMELTATLLSDSYGQPIGMAVILHDITKRKQYSRKLQRQSTILNKRSEERTQELAEKLQELTHANVELQQLDQTRTEFISLVSHQIRAPLTNMAGAIQRMQTDCNAINPTCLQMFGVLEQQISRLDRLVHDVLNASRIEAGEITYQLEPISIVPILRQVVEQLSTRTIFRQIQITDKPGMPLIYADRDRLLEVLTNLLDNADKYSPPEKTVFVDIRADQSEVAISVRDSGSGLCTDDLERVFNKFYRADSSDSQAVYGYGLGLYVCRRIVEAQGGRIWAENHPSGGAVFTFSLPVWQGING